jgi:hypothetical protein
MTEQAFAVWVAGLVFGAMVLIGGWITYWVYRAKLLEREERRLMIERGMIPPPPQATGWPAVRAREQELKFEERRLRIEKGLSVPEDPANTPRDVLRRGLVSLALGLGLAGGYIVFKTSGFEASETTENWLLFFGVISPGVAFYGIANIVHHTMTRSRAGEAETSAPGPLR